MDGVERRRRSLPRPQAPPLHHPGRARRHRRRRRRRGRPAVGAAHPTRDRARPGGVPPRGRVVGVPAPPRRAVHLPGSARRRTPPPHRRPRRQRPRPRPDRRDDGVGVVPRPGGRRHRDRHLRARRRRARRPRRVGQDPHPRRPPRPRGRPSTARGPSSVSRRPRPRRRSSPSPSGSGARTPRSGWSSTTPNPTAWPGSTAPAPPCTAPTRPRPGRIAAHLLRLEAEVERWRFRPGQLVILDEASLAATTALDRIAACAGEAGAKLLLVGDWAQLSAVDAGGAFGLLARDRGPGIPELGTARRFTHPWERTATTRLRVGDVAVLDDYEAHDRIHGGDTRRRPRRRLHLLGPRRSHRQDVAADRRRRRDRPGAEPPGPHRPGRRRARRTRRHPPARRAAGRGRGPGRHPPQRPPPRSSGTGG